MNYLPRMEAAALGGAIRDDRCYQEVVSRLTADHFEPGIRQRMFALMVEMDDLQGGSCPPEVFVETYIQHHDCTPQEGLEVIEILETAPATPTWLTKIIIPDLDKAYYRRELVSRFSAALVDARDTDIDPDSVAVNAIDSLSSLLMGSKSGSDPMGAAECLVAMDAAQVQAGGDVVKVGIDPVDRVLDGLRPGQTLVVGARPGCGKSALAVQIAAKSMIEGRNTLFISLEMLAEELSERFVSHLSLVDSYRVRAGRYSGDEGKAVDHARQRFVDSPLFIYDKSPALDKVVAVIRRNHQKHGAGLVVVDYMQRVRGGNIVKDRHDLVIANITRTLTDLAKELKVPMVILAQPNRQGAESLAMHHLEGSGAIEQDAHKIILMSRLSEVEDGVGEKEVELKFEIAKNRGGMVGKFKVLFQKQYSRFVEIK